MKSAPQFALLKCTGSLMMWRVTSMDNSQSQESTILLEIPALTWGKGWEAELCECSVKSSFMQLFGLQSPWTAADQNQPLLVGGYDCDSPKNQLLLMNKRWVLI